MASTSEGESNLKLKISSDGRRKREGECYAYQAGKRFATSHAPSLWTGSIPAGKLGSFQVCGAIWLSRVQGATVDGKKGGRLPV